MVTKVVTAKLNGGKPRKHSVVEKRVRRPDGKVVVVREIDANSKTFADDLTYVFQKNVARARRENKRILGTADFVPGADAARRTR